MKLIIIILLLSISFCFAVDKRKIGLVPFENITEKPGYEWVSYGLEYLLSNKLSVLSGFFVSEKDQFTEALNEANFGQRPVDERMIYHIGKYSGVEVVVWGAYETNGQSIKLEVVYGNGFNGTTILKSKYEEPLSNLFEISRKIVDQLINLAGINVLESERRLLNLSFTNSISAFESFIKGYIENEKDNSRIEMVTGLFRKAIREDPKFWEAYYNLGIVYFNTKQYDRALDQFNAVIAALPNFDKPYYGRALIYEKMDNYDAAINDFITVTKFNPNDYKTYYYLGRLSIRKKDYQKAEEFLKKAEEINPEFAPTYYELGNIYYEQDLYRQSINYYKRTVDLDNDNAKYHRKLGDTYYRSQIYYNAYNELKKAVALDPDDPISHFLLGITIYKQAVMEELVEAFLDLLSEDAGGNEDEDRRNNLNLDPVKKRQVYLDMAIAFGEALKNRPGFMEAAFNLALTYHEMGDYENAEKYYVTTLQINPDIVRAYTKLAELYTETARKNLAIEMYRKVFKIDPAYFVHHPTLGPEHQYINILEKFRREVDEKLNRNPNDPQANLIMAKIFKAQGHLGKAANLLRKVLTNSPNNTEAKQLLASIQGQ